MTVRLTRYSVFFLTALISLPNFGSCSILFFNNFFVSRDVAEFCCQKYGMTIMRLESIEDSNQVETTLRGVQGVTEMWLSLFHSENITSINDFVWSDGSSPSWTNWNLAKIQASLDAYNASANDVICVKAVLGESMGLEWEPSECAENITFGCHVGKNASLQSVSNPNKVACPHLKLLKAKEIVRNGTVALNNNTVHSQTYAFYDVLNEIKEMGTQIGSRIVDNTVDCALVCLSEEECVEAIIVGKMLCILYK